MTIYSTTYRSSANWPNPSVELKELLSTMVEKKLDDIAVGIVNKPGIDGKMATQQVKIKLNEPVTREARHIIQLDIINDLESQWDKCKSLIESFNEAASHLKGTLNIDSDIKKKNDVFLQREIVFSKEKKFFDAQAKFGSDLGQHSIEVIELAKGVEWSTDGLGISIHTPIVQNSCSGLSTPCIQSGMLEIEVRNNRMVSIVLASKKDEDVTSLTDPSKFGIGTFYFSNFKVEIEQGDSLTIIANKINSLQNDNIASVELDKVTNKYRLVLTSKKLGIENAPNIEEIGTNIFQNRIVSEPEYVAIKLTNGMSLLEVTESINSYRAEHGVIASYIDQKLTLHSTVTGTGNDIKLKNEKAVFGDLFNDSSGNRRKSIIEQNAQIRFDGAIKSSKGNDINVKFPGGEIFFSLYDKPDTPGEKQNITIRANQNAIINAVDEFLVSYYKILSFLAIRESQKKIIGAALQNIPETVQFNELAKALMIENIYGKFLFEEVGIYFKQDKLTAFEDKNYNDIRSTDEISRSLLVFDKIKFKEALDKKFEQVKNLFVYNAKGSKNLYPFPMYKNGIQYNIIDSIDFDINKDRAAFQSNVSTLLTTRKVFKSGVFFLNGQFINTKDGDDIDNLVRKINEVQNESKIKARVIPDGVGYRVTLEQSADFNKIYDPLVKWPPMLVDYDNILDGIFAIEPENYKSADFTDLNVSVTNSLDDHSNPNFFTNGTFFINNIPITVMENDTLQNIHDKINNANAGVRAKIEMTAPGKHNLHIVAHTEVNVRINDQDNVLNNVLKKISEDRGQRFFDTAKIVQLNIRRFEEDNVKKALYVPDNFISINKEADILTLDWPYDTAIPTNGLKMIYFGDGYENIKLKITQGIADKFYNVLDGYLAFNGFVKNAESTIKQLQKDEKDEIQRINEDEIKKIELNIKKELANIAIIQSKAGKIQSLFSKNK